MCLDFTSNRVVLSYLQWFKIILGHSSTPNEAFRIYQLIMIEPFHSIVLGAAVLSARSSSLKRYLMKWRKIVFLEKMLHFF